MELISFSLGCGFNIHLYVTEEPQSENGSEVFTNLVHGERTAFTTLDRRPDDSIFHLRVPKDGDFLNHILLRKSDSCREK